MNSRALAAVLLVVALVVIGIVIFLQGPPSGGGSNTNTTTGSTSPSVDPRSRAIATGDATSKPVRQETGNHKSVNPKIIPDADEPVVLRGKVTIPTGVHLDALQVELYDAAGDIVASGDPEPDGTYEVRYGRTLLSGWFAATSWAGIVSADGKTPAKTSDLTPVYRKFTNIHLPTEPPVECNFVISTAPVVTGKVTSRATGQPIEGATISIVPGFGPFKDSPSEDTETDAEGKFTIKIQELPAQDMIISCKTDDDQYQSAAVGPVDLAPGETRSVDFVLDAATVLTGRVVDDSTGAGIPNATVTLTSTDYGFVSGLTFSDEIVQTDANGAFEIEAHLLPLDRSIIKVEAKEFGAATRTAKQDQILEIRLGKPIVVSGQLLDSSGKPIIRTQVAFCYPNEWQWCDLSREDFAITDSEGKFRVTLVSVPADIAVIYIDQEPFAPFMAPLKEIQSKSSSATTRDLTITLKVGA
ncbi:MAG: carboxypeptidase regulatory-like domain-containing protein [Planctomycetota bacterium]